MSLEEDVILRNLHYNEDFARKVLPYFREDFFTTAGNKIYFSKVNQFFQKYNNLPALDALLVDLRNSKIPEGPFKEALEAIDLASKKKGEIIDPKWLLDASEQFGKDRSLDLALQDAINISNGDNKQLTKTAIPEILGKALQFTLDNTIGHDYIEDAMKRYDYYTKKTSKIPFHLDVFNKITDGGAERKTINTILAGTGVGKSLMMCDLAANYALAGLNVLYITLEMAEEKIAQRIDANLMHISMGEFSKLPKQIYQDKLNQVKSKCKGIIKIKEYPNFGGHVGNFRFLLREYKSKQNFVPDIIFIDYLNICGSSRVKFSGDSSYGYVKAVSEELRGLAVENNICLWTATQTNRSGLNNSDIDITNTSESIGGPMTFDFYIALVATEELVKMGQVMIIQLKSRYDDLHKLKKFPLGLDRVRMKFYDLNVSSNPPASNSPSWSKPASASSPISNPVANKPGTNLNFKGVKI